MSQDVGGPQKSEKARETATHLWERPKSEHEPHQYWRRCGHGQYADNRNVIHCRWVCRMGQPLWKTAWKFLTKLNLLFFF